MLIKILCTDARIKGIRNTKCKQIIALVTREDKTEITLEFYPDGTFYRTEESYFDLFFAEEEEELTEFEKEILNLLNCATPEGHGAPTIEKTKEYSQKLLDLARKELEANYYTKVLDDRMVFKSDLHDRDMQGAYELGKQDALKDLPKWKKIIKPEQNYLGYGFLSWDDYYLSIDELKQKLPKEE